MLSNQANSTSSYFLAEKQSLITAIFTPSSMKLLIPDQMQSYKKAKEVNGRIHCLSASQGPEGKYTAHTSFQSIILTQTENRSVLPHRCLQLMDTIVTVLTFLFIGNVSLSYCSGKKHLLLTHSLILFVIWEISRRGKEINPIHSVNCSATDNLFFSVFFLFYKKNNKK